jgi:Rod binding domain-containing protein
MTTMPSMASLPSSLGSLPPSLGSPPSAATLGALAGSAAKLDPKAKARVVATNFEQFFLNSMFTEMFAGLDGDGPLGGGGGAGVWRSFLTDEYAKSFAKQGGLGIADQVYSSLLAHQEAATKTQ